MTYHEDCLCAIVWRTDIGRHDPVTGEWLPEAPVTIVRLEPHPSCPLHPKPCDHCDGTGEVWEPCCCYQCEYEDTHGGLVPCGNCDGTGAM